MRKWQMAQIRDTAALRATVPVRPPRRICADSGSEIRPCFTQSPALAGGGGVPGPDPAGAALRGLGGQLQEAVGRRHALPRPRGALRRYDKVTQTT